MRLSHPISWVLGIAAIALFFIAIALMKAWRRAAWPRERKRRAGRTTKTTARVESSTRLTAKVDFQLVLAVVPPAPPPSYRDGTACVRLRGVARLPDAVVAWLEACQELPIRVRPSEPLDLAIDLEEILGPSAEAFERDAFLERGAPTWRVVHGAPA